MRNQLFIYKLIPLVLVITLLFSYVPCISHAQGRPKIYWAESDTIKRANLDGTNVENVLTNDDLIRGIALDIQNHKIYWIGGEHSIKRANLDGTKVETIYNPQALNADKVERIHSPVTIALDTSAKKIYWGNMWGPWGMTRADFDGANIEDIRILPVDGGLFDIRVDAEDIQLDLKTGKIYFQDSLNDNIARVDMDGSNYEKLPHDTPFHDKIALDLINRIMYWTEHISGSISKVPLDGKNAETFLSDLNRPTYIALDVRSYKIYWVEWNVKLRTSKIRRANLDGSNLTDIFTELNYIGGIAIDNEGVYDVSPDTNKLTTTWANIKTQ